MNGVGGGGDDVGSVHLGGGGGEDVGDATHERSLPEKRGSGTRGGWQDTWCNAVLNRDRSPVLSCVPWSRFAEKNTTVPAGTHTSIASSSATSVSMPNPPTMGRCPAMSRDRWLPVATRSQPLPGSLSSE